MQNRYAGDVADFGKYGLLRCLSGQTQPDGIDLLPVGVVWYMHPDECGNRDGKRISYLDDTETNKRDYRECDPGLWDLLYQLVIKGGARCVHCVQKSPVLPQGTQFYDAMLQYWPMMDKPLRETLRKRWLRDAIQAVEGSELVMLDPDNGITEEGKMYWANGPKHVYPSDIRKFWDLNKSLIIYHHLGRGGAADDQIISVARTVQNTVGAAPISLRFHRGSPRVFLVVPQRHHREQIEQRVERFLDEEWGKQKHFSRVT